MPAAEIEGLVLQILAGTLVNREWLLANVPQAVLIAEHQAVVGQAQRMQEIPRGEDAIAKRGLLLELLDRAVLADGRIELRAGSVGARLQILCGCVARESKLHIGSVLKLNEKVLLVSHSAPP